MNLQRTSTYTWLAFILIIVGLTVFTNKEVLGYIVTGIGVVILVFGLIKPTKVAQSDSSR